jgi:glycosyltransferase involved in cell wall biosynthesis
MTVKVSVVIATYNSPPELDDLVASLDAQSLPRKEYEVVLVDDGSTDSTFERLQKIAAERSNCIIDRIPNSGWPGRPRNVGTRAASGEYVFYGDHDDYLFPEALERMYDFATAHDLDVVHPKEVVRGWAAPGWVTWRNHVPRVAELDHVALQCISPHKLYRRSFLLEKDVWFPEGRVRLEDFSLNGRAWSRTDAIGIMADYPCYRWVIHQDNSHKQSYDLDIYWASFRASLDPVLTEVPEGPKRYHLLVRWYKSRILERAKVLDTYPDDYRGALLEKFRELMPLFPAQVDAYMPPADRARSALLRQGDADGMVELARLDRGTTLGTTDLRADWVDGRLHLLLVAEMRNSDGTPFAVHTAGDRVRRTVPERLRAAVGEDALDITDDLRDAFTEIVVRSRRDSVDWILSSESTVDVVTRDDTQTIQTTVSAVIDPRTAAMGRPLAPDLWDVYFRLSGLGYTATRRIPAGPGHESVALVEGQPVVVYQTPKGFLAMDLSGQVRTLVAAAAPTPGELRQSGRHSEVALPSVHVSGSSEVDGWVSVDGRRVPARLLADDGAAVIRTDSRLQGRGKVRAQFAGKATPVLFTLERELSSSVAGAVRGRMRRVLRRLGGRRRRGTGSP